MHMESWVPDVETHFLFVKIYQKVYNRNASFNINLNMN
jgi:hypothetical protein